MHFMGTFPTKFSRGALCVALGSGIATAFAGDGTPRHPLLSDRYFFTLGAYDFDNTSEASVSPTGGGSSMSVDFENATGLSGQKTTPVLGFIWRASERWQVETEYFQLKRDADHRLASDVQWGNVIYPAGTNISSRFDVSDARVTAGYSFFRTDDQELGAGFGLHFFKLETALSATGSGSTSGRKVSNPLPVINMYGNFALTDAWAIRLRADWLSLENGGIRDTSIVVHYQPWEHVGLGLGVRSLEINIDINSADWQGEAEIKLQGPTAFVSASF